MFPLTRVPFWNSGFLSHSHAAEHAIWGRSHHLQRHPSAAPGPLQADPGPQPGALLSGLHGPGLPGAAPGHGTSDNETADCVQRNLLLHVD